ncbi:glycerophosphodiester phosphodiesterase family protein [Geodermatophilus sp. SYSU D00742]
MRDPSLRHGDAQVSPLSSELWATHGPEFALCSGLCGVVDDMHARESLAVRPAIGLPRPVVVGHRGASAYRPEHTAASYELAIDLGADLIEPDIVVSRDGALVVRHDRELSLTTDVGQHRRFADRRTTKVVRGRPVSDWFVEDFDLDELRSLRAVERFPSLRSVSALYDGRSGILTLAEVVELAQRHSKPHRTVGVLVEISPGLSGGASHVAPLVAAELRRLGVAGATSGVVLQSFEPEALRALREDLGDDGPPMVQLVDDGPENDWLLLPSTLRAMTEYACAVGPSRHRLLLRNPDQSLQGTTDLVDRAGDAGLDVWVWTLCPENAFLPIEWRRGTGLGQHGDGVSEARLLLDLGAAALISDAPDVTLRACAVSEPALVGPVP